MPQPQEFLKRAQDVMAGVLDGRFEHSDLAAYLLQLSASVEKKRCFLKKRDMRDLRVRLVGIYPPVDASTVPKKEIRHLPQCLREFLGNHVNMWRVEWMYKGAYSSQRSVSYKDRFSFSKMADKKVYQKLVDTLGFSRWNTAHRMWIESLYRPQQVVKYEGKAFDLQKQETVIQTAKMMTYIIDYEHIITCTIVQ